MVYKLKTIFEQRIEAINAEHKNSGGKEPQFGFSFVGETSPEAELQVQTKFILALLDINAMKIF